MPATYVQSRTLHTSALEAVLSKLDLLVTLQVR